MAPRRHKTQTATVDSELEEGAHGDIVGSDVMKAAQNIVNLSKKRRGTKRINIERDHQQNCLELKARIENAYAVRKSKANKSHQELYERLEALNDRREALEKLILVSTKQIELQTKNISSEMAAILRGRLEELEELCSEAAAV